MIRRIYSDEQRAEALQLLQVVGAAEAARRTGIKRGTLVSWAHRAGLRSADPEQRREHVQAAQQAWAERRAVLADMLGEAADEATQRLLQRIRSGNMKDAELIRAVAVLVDRAQLLTGGATERIEHGATVERTPEHEAEVAQVLHLIRGSA